jgi:DNA-binding CsgD family transcriptional regulator
MLAAAQAWLMAGDQGAAVALVAQAAPHLDEPLGQAQAKRLEGAARLWLARPAEASPLLLEAGKSLGPLHPRQAWDALVEAFESAWAAQRFARGAGTAEVLRAVRSTPRLGDAQMTATDHILESFSLLDEKGDRAGVARLREALGHAMTERPLGDQGLHFFVIGPLAAHEVLDDGAWHTMCVRGVEHARRQGALTSLLRAIRPLIYFEPLAGRFSSADALCAEVQDLGAATGVVAHVSARVVELAVLAWRGNEAALRPLAAARVPEFTEIGYGLGIVLTDVALTVLELGLGNYQAALRHARNARNRQALATIESIPELIEAAARCGELDMAASALERFAARAQASGTDWALGMLLRSRALLAEDDDAEELYRAAIEHLERCQIVPQLGRAHLVHGEWLRRQHRRRDARSALRTAYEILDGIGAEAFAERARVELVATGEHVRKHRVEDREELTPQELQIAGLVADGATNPEIANQLFISANTVAYHLKKVFRKLEVTNRAALAHALEGQS